MRRFLYVLAVVAFVITVNYNVSGDLIGSSAAEKDEIANDLLNRSTRNESPAVEAQSYDNVPQPAVRAESAPTGRILLTDADKQEILEKMFGSANVHRLASIPYETQERLLSKLIQPARTDRSPSTSKYTPGSSELRPHLMGKKPRGLAPAFPGDKIQRMIYERNIPPYAINEDGTVNLTSVFLKETPREVAISIIQRYGIVLDAPRACKIFMCSMPEDAILNFASENSVRWVELAPPDKEMHLDQSRAAINADAVQAPPYSLDGSGVTVSITDGGWVDRFHDDFLGRITIGDDGCGEPDCATHYHATHVGGILAGDGTLSGGTYRGLATASDIRSYEWPDNITELDNEITNALTNGSILSSNSWSWAVSASRGNCSIHGDYDAWSERYDEIINGDLGDEIVVICSAGNEENDGDCPPYPWNQVNPPIATSKNAICVGAVYSDTYDHTCFSSRGPLDDGRLKPDLVAPGDEANDHATECLMNDMIRSTFPGDTYDDIAGTSMSTPMVSGAVALMREQFSILGYIERKPHTYKAILIQTADDLGNPGPDYTYGHGMLDVQEAIDYVIRNSPNSELVRLGTVVDNETDTYYMSVPDGVSELRVTLAWDDLPGTSSAIVHQINNLDLYLRSPTGTYYYAYVLDWNNPGNNATTGWNYRDNVEVVEVQNPEPGKWEVRVWGWDIPAGSEAYTVIMPYEDINCGDYLYHDTELGHDLVCTGHGLNLDANGITFDGGGYTISGDLGASDYGIWIVGNKNITIRNANISSFGYGIYMSNADSCVIGAYDSLTNNVYGMKMLGGSDANIVGMSWIENNQEEGIALENADYNIVGIWNEIDNNKRNVLIEAEADYNSVYGNGIHDGAFYGVFCATGGIQPTNDSTSYNIIYNNNYGIRYYQGGSNNNILENEIYDNIYGIYMYSTADHRVYNNIINSNDSYGVYLTTSATGVTLDSNEVCTNPWDIYDESGVNAGNENMCDVVFNWADDGQASGGDWQCSGCRQPEDNLIITSDMTLCPGTYNIPDLGIYGVLILDANGITLDCNGAILDGTGSIAGGEAVRSYGDDNNTVINGNFRNYPYGIFLTQSANNNVVHNNNVLDCITGLRSYNSTGNIFSENTVIGGTYGILLAGGASANHYLHDNEFCENTYDIYNEGTAAGNNNRCDSAYAYVDSGQAVNCDYQCTDCLVQPIAIDFGSVPIGGYADRTFDIINLGVTTLNGTVSEACDYYWILSGEGAYSLPPGETLTVEIRLKPGAYGTHLCTIQTGAECSNVSCTGVTPDLSPPVVSVIYPNGGEQFEPGDSIFIEWSATDDQGVDSISLYYSENAGVGYSLIAGGEPNSSPYLWIAPSIESDSCLVKVVAYDPGLNTGDDESDSLFTIKILTGVGGDLPVLADKLEQNYPNPFNPSTNIVFSIVRTGHVSLKIYDVSGRLVRVLVNEEREAGRHKELWDGKDNNARHVASGVYFCRFQAGTYMEIQKMVLLR
ncbi:MAG: S8 family serine peptidase [Candidatus Latescibacteria bacterium]|nr:S8 family serine peptidase [Candidatus Latescibacterota bacterium]NIO57215.1 S8 family serine peptidase [Candidatus Latescibacterota bacterium]